MKKLQERARTRTTSRGNGATRSGSDRRERPRIDRLYPKTELEAAVERYADLYDYAPIGYVSFDRAGKIEEANLAASELLGEPRQSIIGRPFAFYVADLDTFMRHLFDCRASQRQVITEVTLKPRRGQHIPVLLVSRPVTSTTRNGALLYQTAMMDLHERKAHEQRLAEQARLLDLSNDAIIVRDTQDRITYWNRGAQAIYGYTREEALGKVTHELLNTTHPEPLPAIKEKLLRDGRWQGEVVHSRRDGTRLTVFSRWALDHDTHGNPASMLETNNDITERKRTEEQQQALYRFVQRQAAAKSLDEIYSAALDAVICTSDCDRASILLFDRSSVMRFVDWRGLSTKYRRAVEGHSPWTPESENPQPITIPDADRADMPVWLKSVIKAEGIRAALFIPLIARGKLIGKFMTYYNAPHVFMEKDLSLGVSIARQLTLGLERKRAEEELRKSKLLLEQRVQQRTEALRTANRELQREIERRKGLEGEILEVSDREQQRLGQELHDSLCQQLTAIGFIARATALRLKDHRVVQVEDLEKIAQLINATVSDARHIARDLHKEEVDAAGFVEALRSLTQREMWKTRCRLELKTDVHLEDDRMASQLYRILREALINAHKHAQASRVVLEVRQMKNNLVFSVTDNGVGFGGKTKTSRGLGFHIMQYRARSVGARLKVESPAKGGARVVCYLRHPNGSK
jgi:PAS domain S-box-containing protein